jgi:hypothetical protein
MGFLHLEAFLTNRVSSALSPRWRSSDRSGSADETLFVGRTKSTKCARHSGVIHMRTAVVLFMSCFSFVQGAHAQSLPVSPIGNSAQDFGGIRTFLRAPHVTDVATLKADIAVVGMPFDQGTSNRPGQRYGPRDIREASLIYAWAPEKGFYYIDTGQTVLKGKRWADLGDVDVVPSDPLRTSQNMTSAVAAILERGAFPVILGGDHSITFPAVRAYKLPSLTVVHFDAHLDSYGNGDPNVLSHGEWVQQVGKLPGVRFIQIGMRGIVNDAGGVTAAQKLGSTIITAERVHRDEKARPSLVQTDLAGC